MIYIRKWIYANAKGQVGIVINLILLYLLGIFDCCTGMFY